MYNQLPQDFLHFYLLLWLIFVKGNSLNFSIVSGRQTLKFVFRFKSWDLWIFQVLCWSTTSPLGRRLTRCPTGWPTLELSLVQVTYLTSCICVMLLKVAKAREGGNHERFCQKNLYKNQLNKLSQYARTLTKQKVDSGKTRTNSSWLNKPRTEFLLFNHSRCCIFCFSV